MSSIHKPQLNKFITYNDVFQELIAMFTLHPFSRTMSLRLTQPLTEMSARNLPGVKGRPTRNTENLTAVCETIF
jgi:hypothetical protein